MISTEMVTFRNLNQNCKSKPVFLAFTTSTEKRGKIVRVERGYYHDLEFEFGSGEEYMEFRNQIGLVFNINRLYQMCNNFSNE